MTSSRGIVTAGAVEEDPVGDAEDVLRVARARRLLLAE
jgi:hypothetical protein